MECISLLRKLVVSLGREYTYQKNLALKYRTFRSSVFNDFGPKFTCVDPTGESPLSGMIVSVEQVRIPYGGATR